MYDQQHHNDPYKNSGQVPPPGYAQPAYGQPAYGQQAYAAQPYMAAPQPPQHMYGGDASTQGVAAIKPADTTPASGCRDLPFGILFIANVGAIVACMVLWGLDAIKKDAGITTSSRTTPNSKKAFLTADQTRNVIVVALGMALLAVVLGLASIKLITTYARCMIIFTLWFNVAFAFAIAAFGFMIGNIFMGVIGVIFALLSLCYARAVQPHIPFAVANLRVASAVISKHWSTYLVSIMFTFVQIAWVVLWALAFLGVANKLKRDPATTVTLRENGAQCIENSQCQSFSCKFTAGFAGKRCVSSVTSGFQNASPTNYVVYFFLLISFYWGIQVFKNLAHTTIAGTVAAFWYSTESAGATGKALVRTMTTSFGSVCFGSLIVAIIQALRALAEQSRQEGSFLGCIAECLLGCLQSIMEYINRWAFVYVGMYGYKFTQAGKAVFQLFRERGFDAIINDDLIGNVLGFAALAVGLICAGIGAAIAQYTKFIDFNNSIYFLIILGLIVGYGVAITPLSVVDSSIATIFVCFAEDPAAFAASHPDLYQPLVAEWHNLYPEIMVQAGYWH